MRNTTTENVVFAHYTLDTLPASLRRWIRKTATPDGDAICALDLFETDRIGHELPIIVACCLDSRVAGWGLLRGYLGIFVEPLYRRRRLGSALVHEFVKLYGTDLLFRTEDPGARAMFLQHLRAR